MGAKNPFSTFWRAGGRRELCDFRASSARFRSLKSARGRQKVTDARELGSSECWCCASKKNTFTLAKQVNEKPTRSESIESTCRDESQKKYDTGRDKRDGHYSRHNHRKCKIATHNRSTVRACDFIEACAPIRPCSKHATREHLARPHAFYNPKTLKLIFAD